MIKNLKEYNINKIFLIYENTTIISTAKILDAMIKLEKTGLNV